MYVYKAEFCLTIELDGSIRLSQAVLGDAVVKAEIVLRQVVDHHPHIGLVALLLGGGLVSRARWWGKRWDTKKRKSK